MAQEKKLLTSIYLQFKKGYFSKGYMLHKHISYYINLSDIIKGKAKYNKHCGKLKKLLYSVFTNKASVTTVKKFCKTFLFIQHSFYFCHISQTIAKPKQTKNYKQAFRKTKNAFLFDTNLISDLGMAQFEISSLPGTSLGPGKTTYIVSASFRNGNGYIWQAILT